MVNLSSWTIRPTCKSGCGRDSQADALFELSGRVPLTYSLDLWTVITFILELNVSNLPLDACDHACDIYIPS
jgi:hypothetical protein